MGDDQVELLDPRMRIILTELDSGNDRSVAIVAGTWLDETLKEALQSYFVGDPNFANELLSDNRNLGSCAMRAMLGRVLNFYSQDIYEDMSAINTIRNKFAHSLIEKNTANPLTFDTNIIADKCAALKLPHKKNINGNPEASTSINRQKFVWTVLLLCKWLDEQTQARTPAPKANRWLA